MFSLTNIRKLTKQEEIGEDSYLSKRSKRTHIKLYEDSTKNLKRFWRWINWEQSWPSTKKKKYCTVKPKPTSLITFLHPHTQSLIIFHQNESPNSVAQDFIYRCRFKKYNRMIKEHRIHRTTYGTSTFENT